MTTENSANSAFGSTSERPYTLRKRVRGDPGLPITTNRRRVVFNRHLSGECRLDLAVDDHSRLAYSEILPDETRRSCLKFLFNALRFYRDHGVRVLRVMTDNTDNGVSFRSRRSTPLHKGVANAKNQAQAHQTLYAKNKRKGRTLRADLLAAMGLRQTIQSFIRTGRRTVAFPPQL